MNVDIHCPACGEPDVVSDAVIGKRAQCNRCHQIFWVAASGSQRDDEDRLSPLERRLLFGGIGVAIVVAVVLSCVLFLPQHASQTTSVAPSNIQAPVVPPDVTYSPIDVKTNPPYKREISVRLSRKVDEQELGAIGEKIKSNYPLDCERTLIFYFLPGTTVGKDVCWATTHFSPDLNVRINYGGFASEEKRVSQQRMGTAGLTVGEWLDTQDAVGTCRIRIFIQGAQAFIERRWGDGSTGIRPLIESQSAEGRRFTAADSSSFPGDYMLVDREGNLQYHDNEGLIYSVGPSR